MKILVLSNGHGEDSVGAAICSEIMRLDSSIRISVMPLVGKGNAYERIGLAPLGPRREMPSGGFVHLGAGRFLADLSKGLVSKLWREVRILKDEACDSDLLVGVGDSVSLYINALFLKKPMVWVSIYYSGYNPNVMRSFPTHVRRFIGKYCIRSFYRDPILPEILSGLGMDGVGYVGNPMMDLVVGGDSSLFDRVDDGTDDQMREKAEYVCILPGSREDLYGNMREALRACSALLGMTVRDLRFRSPLPASADIPLLDGLICGEGWNKAPVSDEERDKGIVGIYKRKEEDGSPDGRGSLILTKGAFGDTVRGCRVVIGLAGTAVEQAVGMGCPAVAFDTGGIQTSKRFLRRQKMLLGDGIEIVEGGAAAAAESILKILSDSALHNRMVQSGMERMGPGGASRKIAREIVGLLKTGLDWK